MEHTFIDHPAAWKGSDFTGKDDIAFDLGPAHLAAFHDAVTAVQKRGLKAEGFGREDFDLSPIADDVAAIRDILMSGRGIVILRGLPVERYDLDSIAILYWGLGTHLGEAVSQSRMGDRLGHVVDASGKNPRERGYRSSKELDLHTDSDDIVGLFCLRGAKSGGVSRLVSALAVHNEINASHPEYLALLYRGFHYHWRGEEPEGEPPITDYRVPVFSRRDGVVSCCYLRSFIDMAAAEMNQPLSDLELAALVCFEALSNREDMLLKFELEAGEALFFNNYEMLHSRTAFEDHADEQRRRHLLRLWLAVPDGRPIDGTLRRYYGDGGIKGRSDGNTIYQGATLLAK
jgi:hypothetical protein